MTSHVAAAMILLILALISLANSQGQTTQSSTPTVPSTNAPPPSDVTDININIQTTLNTLPLDDLENVSLQPFRESRPEVASKGAEGVQKVAKKDASAAQVSTEVSEARSTETTTEENQKEPILSQATATSQVQEVAATQATPELVQSNTSAELQSTEAPSSLNSEATLQSIVENSESLASTTSDSELNAQAATLNSEPVVAANLMPHTSEVSVKDEPMMADSPHSEVAEQPRGTNEIISNIHDKIKSMSDTFADKTKDVDKSIENGRESLNTISSNVQEKTDNMSDTIEDKTKIAQKTVENVKEGLNATNGDSGKGSINNENLNPISSSSFGGKQDKANKNPQNTLTHKIRQSLANTSDVMVTDGSQTTPEDKMAVKVKASKRIKFQKESTDNEESVAPDLSTVEMSVTPVMVSGVSSNGSSNSSTHGQPSNSFNASADVSSTHALNLTNSHMTHALNQTEHDVRAALKAKNAGSRPVALLDLQGSGWITLLTLVTMTTRI